MKPSLFRSTTLVIAAVALVSALAATASAGYRAGSAVSVWPGVNASGSLATARSSGDPSQYIGCGMWAQRSFPGISIYCYAQNTAPDGSTRSLYCYTSDPGVVQSFYAIKADSRIQFQVDANGACTGLSVWNASYEPVKVP